MYESIPAGLGQERRKVRNSEKNEDQYRSLERNECESYREIENYLR